LLCDPATAITALPTDIPDLFRFPHRFLDALHRFIQFDDDAFT